MWKNGRMRKNFRLILLLKSLATHHFSEFDSILVRTYVNILQIYRCIFKHADLNSISYCKLVIQWDKIVTKLFYFSDYGGLGFDYKYHAAYLEELGSIPAAGICAGITAHTEITLPALAR